MSRKPRFATPGSMGLRADQIVEGRAGRCLAWALGLALLLLGGCTGPGLEPPLTSSDDSGGSGMLGGGGAMPSNGPGTDGERPDEFDPGDGGNSGGGGDSAGDGDGDAGRDTDAGIEDPGADAEAQQ